MISEMTSDVLIAPASQRQNSSRGITPAPKRMTVATKVAGDGQRSHRAHQIGHRARRAAQQRLATSGIMIASTVPMQFAYTNEIVNARTSARRLTPGAITAVDPDHGRAPRCWRGGCAASSAGVGVASWCVTYGSRRSQVPALSAGCRRPAIASPSAFVLKSAHRS